MKFSERIKKFDTILENGPLGTRLKYEYGIESITDIVNQENLKDALARIYEGDLVVAQKHNMPIILNAATYRASRNHLTRNILQSEYLVKNMNVACVNLVKKIRMKHAVYQENIFIGAPLGSMYDAYCVDKIPTIHEAMSYHKEQINILSDLDVDFLNVVTLPSLNEAVGIALAAEKADIEYTIGFVLSSSGRLLDGNELQDAIELLDSMLIKKPLGYMITCTHASIILKLRESSIIYDRLIGVQPNGSDISLDQLSSLKNSVCDTPEKFSRELIELRKKFGLKFIGGCCGTDRRHLETFIENNIQESLMIKSRL